MLVIVIMHHTRPKQPWELLHTPPAVEFDEYSIVSSNEFCNELARMTVQEDHVPFLGLVLVMDLCLSLTEPQAGGWGGDSVVVYSNAFVSMSSIKCDSSERTTAAIKFRELEGTYGGLTIV